jgi:uncharacterized protein YwgA
MRGSTRKKVVYLLQVKGCPFVADYTLHFYGPYSQEVAQLGDQMTAQGLLRESSGSNMVGQPHEYVLADVTRQQVTEVEQTPVGRQARDQMTAFEPLARQLLSKDLKQLELAVTIVYFRQHGRDWAAAVEATSKFKQQPVGSPSLTDAEELAREIAN